MKLENKKRTRKGILTLCILLYNIGLFVATLGLLLIIKETLVSQNIWIGLLTGIYGFFYVILLYLVALADFLALSKLWRR